MNPPPSPAARRSRLTRALFAVALVLPIGIYFALPRIAPAGAAIELHAVAFPPLEPSPFEFTRSNLGPPPGYRPLITHVNLVDLDRDGMPDVLACDARRNRVIWYRQAPRGQWEERVLGDRDLPAPCHAAAVDLDLDGDLDLVVAVLGSVWPTNDRVGMVAWLENRGGSFITHILLDDIRRVADVQAGDFNGDGKPDLVVAEFGYDVGRVLWLENRGGGKFRDHELLTAPGPIHVPVADFNGDGRLDIAAVISQDSEEVWLFENTGGAFRPRVVAGTPNFDFGSAGLAAADLNRDGKTDLLWVAGDNLEVRYPQAQTWHGCIWLKNLGGGKFEPIRIGTLGGTYAAAAGDLDGDGDLDVVLVSMFNEWRRPGAASVVWLENDGKEGFTARKIAESPTHLATVACGDLDGDGRADVVAGGFHILEPFDRLGRITMWTSRKGPP
jgi:hypothetical protein